MQTHRPSSLLHGAFLFCSVVCVCVYLRQMLLCVLLHPLFSVPLSMDVRVLLQGPAQSFKQQARVSVYPKATPGFRKDHKQRPLRHHPGMDHPRAKKCLMFQPLQTQTPPSPGVPQPSTHPPPFTKTPIDKCQPNRGPEPQESPHLRLCYDKNPTQTGVLMTL